MLNPPTHPPPREQGPAVVPLREGRARFHGAYALSVIRRSQPRTPAEIHADWHAEALRIARCEEHSDRPILRRLAWAVLKAERGQRVQQGILARLPFDGGMRA